MKRDHLVFNIFETGPGTFFELIGKPASEAAGYIMKSIELKDSAVRLDGAFIPIEGNPGPVYLWEAQFKKVKGFYANLHTKMSRYWSHFDDERPIVCVAIFPNESCEWTGTQPHLALENNQQLKRIYPEAGPDQIELAILQLFAIPESRVIDRVKELMPGLHERKLPAEIESQLIQYLINAVLFRIHDLSWEDMKKMLTIEDLKQSRAVREYAQEYAQEYASQEVEKAVEKSTQENFQRVARELLKMNLSMKDISKATGLSIAEIKKLAK
jgi:predicted transposase/invertase (TIGR01784 family)